jgi:hypothetical protein
VAWKEDDLKLTLTDRQARMPNQVLDLLPCAEVGVFMMVVPGVPRGMPVVFRRWSDDRLYMHAGGRSTPRVEATSDGSHLPLETVTE